MKSNLSGIVLCALIGLGSGAANATDYNAFTQFSSSSSSGPIWQYGYEINGGSFTSYSTGQTYDTFYWFVDQGYGGLPNVSAPGTGYQGVSNALEMEAGYNLTPDTTSYDSVVRFIVPVTGAYDISGSFTSFTNNISTLDSIIINGTSYSSQVILGSSFSNTLTDVALTAGSIVDFKVSNGSNIANNTHSPEAVVASVSTAAVPLPAAFWLFCSAITGLGLLGQRKTSAC